MTTARQPPRVTILYEDRRGPTNDFALHQLVLACTADVLAERGTALERYQLEQRITAIPKGPNTQVLRALAQDAERIHRGYTAIVAWLDDDEIHRPLKLPARTARHALLDAIRRCAPSSLNPGAVQAYLTRDNVESFLTTIEQAAPGALPRSLLDRALAKDRTARDLCFRRAAKAEHTALRAALRRDDPSFDGVIRHLACLAAYEPWPPW